MPNRLTLHKFGLHMLQNMALSRKWNHSEAASNETH